MCVFSLWFSATAVIPVLTVEFGLTGARASLLTSSVQIGFVCGTLASALLGLADSLDSRRFFAVSTLIACIANSLILLTDPNSD